MSAYCAFFLSLGYCAHSKLLVIRIIFYPGGIDTRTSNSHFELSFPSTSKRSGCKALERLVNSASAEGVLLDKQLSAKHIFNANAAQSDTDSIVLPTEATVNQESSTILKKSIITAADERLGSSIIRINAIPEQESSSSKKVVIQVSKLMPIQKVQPKAV